jgi:hypothetical protein
VRVVVCQPDPQKARSYVGTRILSHHAPLYNSQFGLGVNLKKLVERSQKKSHNRYKSPITGENFTVHSDLYEP